MTYFETKNNAKWISDSESILDQPRIEILLKKVIGERTEGLLFPVYRKSNTKGKRNQKLYFKW